MLDLRKTGNRCSLFWRTAQGSNRKTAQHPPDLLKKNEAGFTLELSSFGHFSVLFSYFVQVLLWASEA